jgi:hypothetical protein
MFFIPTWQGEQVFCRIAIGRKISGLIALVTLGQQR